jgi:hypothetical protein
MYLWTFHHGNKCLAVAILGGNDIFYAWWIFHDPCLVSTTDEISWILIFTELMSNTIDKMDPIADPNCVAPNSSQTKDKGLALLKYVLIGTVFGIVFVKAEIISWFRIQEMFRLQSFHMFGVIGSAIVTGIISIQLIKRLNIKSIQGEAIIIPTKEFKKGQLIGGFIFGLGWAITGACPGPLFAQIGSGYTVVLVTLVAALAGTWVYGRFEKYFPS